MYKFEIMLRKGFLRVRIWEGMCYFYEETTGIKYGHKKKTLEDCKSSIDFTCSESSSPV